MKTFYIAAGSVQLSQRDQVQELAKVLYHKFGWRWHNNYDWTDGFKMENSYPEFELIYRARMDREGARDCDVFIFLEHDIPSLGANREYGVRWGTERHIYRVSNKKPHLFDRLDSVTTVGTTSVLVEVLERRELRE